MTSQEQYAGSDQGSLADHPFLEALVRLYPRRASGLLTVRPYASRAYALRLEQGRVVAAWVPSGQVSSLPRALMPLVTVEKGEYGFAPGLQSVPAGHPISGVLDPHTFAAQALRTEAPLEAVARTLRRHEETLLRVRPGMDIARLGLQPDECSLLDLLRAEPVTGRVARQQSHLPKGQTERLLYLFLVTDLLAPFDQVASHRPSHTRIRNGHVQSTGEPKAHPAGQSSSSTPQQPARVAPEAAGRPASASQVARASSTPASAAASASTAASASEPAWKRLTARPPVRPTPTTRAPDLPVEALDPTGKLRRALQLGERGHWERGLEIVHELRALDSHNADYVAAEAWLRYLPERGSRLHSREVAEGVYLALRMDNQNPRALYTKGLMLKEQGRAEEAVEYFRRVCDVDPRVLGREDPLRIACERELRLAKMRRKRWLR